MTRPENPNEISSARRRAVCKWLAANGIDTNRVPVDSIVLIRDGAEGRVIGHTEYQRDAIGQQYRVLVETPLTVEPPAAWPA
ncbi:hypothetical protein [Streptomyces sp. NPDC002467]|uniref:hypothetical protein n=1 Tax=Streptomyces sp. NPDC002467 TaxID=3364647 RepID=UPI0036C1971A